MPAEPPTASALPSPAPYRPPASSERYSFKKIMTHQGPLLPNDPRFKGAAFNLKIRWSTQETTWEPFTSFFEDQPLEVIAYAKKHNLLGNRHWSFVRDAALAPPSADPIPSAFQEEYDNVPMDIPFDPSLLVDAPACYRRAIGFFGETCYVIITDRKSGSIRISTCRDKSPPLDFLWSFIANYKPNTTTCRVCFDGGGSRGN